MCDYRWPCDDARYLATIDQQNEEVRATIVEVLCGQALADHLGDVRDKERKLWRLLGIEVDQYNSEPGDDFEANEASTITFRRLKKHGIPLPVYLGEVEE